MRVGVVQFGPVFGDVAGNMDRVLALLEPEDAELFVLPELALSGYLFESREEAEALAQRADGAEFDALATLARDKGATIILGFAEQTEEGLFNSSLMLTSDGRRDVYRKVQLFYKERDVFLPGDMPPRVHDVAGTRLGMMICFDWIYPEVARTLALAGADILCHSSNLVLPYCPDAMVTRSIENRVFSMTANRIGSETRAGEDLIFIGMSEIVSPRGEILVRAGTDSEEVLVIDIDPAAARDKAVTPYNDILNDRRTDMYRLS